MENAQNPQYQKWIHDVIEISAGMDSLKKALAQIDAQGAEVISVFPNTGGRVTSMFGSGGVFGLMIVIRRPV